jgi:ABC-2 type transport system ATP-binding protein
MNIPAIDGLSFSIARGSFFGLLGPNGAGKTTTISILCGYLKATSGEIIMDGIDFSHQQQLVKKIIGVVPQDIALYPTLSALENLRFFGKMYGLKSKQLSEKIEYYLRLFGLENNSRRRVETFSGGMKRRVNLIAGILHAPKILFLDEPTVGIDVQSRTVIVDFLKQLNREGTTIIYTSHHMEEAEQLCSTVAIIDYGKIIAYGNPEELIAKNPECNTLENLFLYHTGRDLRD